MKDEWIVIYYETEDGNCPVEKFINSLPIKNKAKITALIEQLEVMGIKLPRPYADYLRDGIHELRVKLSGKQTRTLYFFCLEQYIVLTHIFIKTTKEVPNCEINKALKCREIFLKNYNQHNIQKLMEKRNENI